MTLSYGPSLDDLPVELAHHTCTFLQTNDLLSLRLVSKRVASLTIQGVAERLASRLRKLYVCFSENGLQVFHGLTQVPELVRHIEKVRFLNIREVLAEFYQQSSGREREFWNRHLTAQVRFEDSSHSLRLLVDAFDNINLGPSLRSIALGYGCGDYLGQPACGIGPLMKEIRSTGILPLSSFLSILYNYGGVQPRHIRTRTELLLRALELSTLDRKVFKVAVHPIASDNDPKDHVPFTNSFWAVLENTHLRKLRIDGRSLANRSLHRHHELEKWKWVQPCLQAVSHVQSLDLSGCNWPSGCTNCPPEWQASRNISFDHDKRQKECVTMSKSCQCCEAISEALGATQFLHLRSLDLQSLSLEPATLKRLLDSSKSCLRKLSLRYIELRTGSWLDIFQFLHSTNSLENIRFTCLSQPITTASLPPSPPPPKPSIDRVQRREITYTVRGKENVARYVGLLLDQFWASLRRLQGGVGWVSIQLPPADYAEMHTQWHGSYTWEKFTYHKIIELTEMNDGDEEDLG